MLVIGGTLTLLGFIVGVATAFEGLGSRYRKRETRSILLWFLVFCIGIGLTAADIRISSEAEWVKIDEQITKSIDGQRYYSWMFVETFEHTDGRWWTLADEENLKYKVYTLEQAVKAGKVAAPAVHVID